MSHTFPDDKYGSKQRSNIGWEDSMSFFIAPLSVFSNIFTTLLLSVRFIFWNLFFESWCTSNTSKYLYIYARLIALGADPKGLEYPRKHICSFTGVKIRVLTFQPSLKVMPRRSKIMDINWEHYYTVHQFSLSMVISTVRPKYHLLL